MTLRIEHEVVPVTVMENNEPDPKWRYVDSSGHEHRWDGSTTPTLEPKVVEEWWCLDCRDMHTETILVCKQCGQEVVPRTQPGPLTSYLRGPARYYLDDEEITEERYRGLVDGLA